MARRRLSPYFEQALELRAYAREQFELWRWSEYERASEFCRGRLLNRRGQAAGVDSYSLFMGNQARAHAYASEELLEYWQTHERPVFARWERATFQA